MGMNLNGDSFDTGNGATKTITTAVFNKNVWLIVYKGTTVNNLTFYPMLIKGTEDKPYEQYGASPSIDYPSEIKTVGSNVNLIPTDETDWEQGTIDSGTPEYSTTRIRTADYCPIKYYEQTISLVNSDSYVFRNIHYYDSNKTYINNQFALDGNKTPTFSKLTFTPPAAAMYFKAVIAKKDNSALTPNKIRDIKPKLEKGTMATLWSPHNQGSVEIDVVNKNFLNIANIEETTKGGITYSIKNGILKLNGTATAGLDIKLSKNIKIKKGKYTHSSSYIQSGLYISFDNLGYTMISSTVGKKRTIEITEDTTYKRYFIWIDKGTVLNNVEIKLQLEVGDTATDFVEHQSQSAIMPIQQEMLTGDYVADVEHHEWGKLVLTGDESFNLDSTYQGIAQFSLFKNAEWLNDNIIRAISNCFKGVQFNGSWTKDNTITTIGGGNIRIMTSKYTTIDTFKAWLKSLYQAGTPVIIYYKLATPVDLALTDEQKKEQNIDLYEERTIITSDAEMQVDFATAEIPLKYFQKFKWGEKFKISRVRYEDGIQLFEKGNTTDNTLYLSQDNMYIVDQQQIDNIYDELGGLELYSFEGDAIVDPALDPGDIVVIDGKQVLYQGTMQFAGKWKTSLTSKLQGKNKEETTVRKPSQKTINRRVQSSINQAEGKIKQLVEETTEQSKKITEVEQTVNGISQKVEDIQDFTKEKTQNENLFIDDIAEGEGYVLKFVVYGNTELFKSKDITICASQNRRGYGEAIYLLTEDGNELLTEDNQPFIIGEGSYYLKSLKIKLDDYLRSLTKDGKNYYDTLEIEQDGTIKIIRRIGVNAQGGLYLLAKETETVLKDKIVLPSQKNGTYYFIKETQGLNYYAQYIIENDYSKTFLTKLELGTKIEQNAESVKIAWNQISEFIQMMIINDNASFAILDKDKKIMMALDKEGQHFYSDDGKTVFGEMGVHKQDNQQYISFSVNGEYENSIKNGMAWGITTKSDGKFHPIFYIRNFKMADKASDASYGELVMASCNLVLDGISTGIQSGNVKMYGNDINNSIVFINSDTGEQLLSISTSQIGLGYPTIEILDKIRFFRNQANSNTLKLSSSDDKYSYMTDDGSMGCNELYCENIPMLIDTNISMISGSADSFISLLFKDSSHVYVYANSSDKNLKKNIKESSTSAIDIIKQIRHVSFDWKSNNKHQKIGYIAQEMQKIDDTFTHYNKFKTAEGQEKEDWQINTLAVLATATKAIQEQQEQIEELKEEIKKLKEEK